MVTKLNQSPVGNLLSPLMPASSSKKFIAALVWQELLNSKDDKIKQRAVERLTDLRYKTAAGLTEEPQRIVIDMPRPDRD